MTPSELEWLAQQASRFNSIIEMGCYYGRTTVAMAANTRGTVWAIDDFSGPRDDGVNTDVKPNLNRTGIYQAFRENTKDYDNIVPLRFDHRQFHTSLLPPRQMAFIDGSHLYEDVKQDILRFLWQRPIFLCGHDIDFPTVRQAVEELIGPYEVAPISSIWYREL